MTLKKPAHPQGSTGAGHPKSKTPEKPAVHSTFKKRLRVWWDDNYWLMIGCAGALAFALGIIGFCQLNNLDGTEKPLSFLLDQVYLALQLFPLNVGFTSGNKPFVLEIARFLAPAVTALAAVKAATLLFKHKFQMFRLGRLKNHAVVCGLGEKGKRLALDLLERKEQVVVIESDPQNSAVENCRDKGAIILMGDAAGPDTLKKSGLARARSVFAVCADDQTNLEIALQAEKLMGVTTHRNRRDSTPLARRCYVHLVDLELRDMLIARGVFSKEKGRVEFKCFNMFENAALQLFRNHPPDHAARIMNNERVHLLIIGFGRMGRSVALQAAKMGHYRNGRAIRISVVDQSAKAKGDLFIHKYPAFKRICDIDFRDLDINDLCFQDGAFLNHFGGMESVTQVIICLEQEPEALRCLIALMKLFEKSNCQLLVRVNTESAFLDLLQNKSCQKGSDGQGQTSLHPFGFVSHCCSHEMVVNELWEALARRVHAGYVSFRKQKIGSEIADDPSLLPWEELTEDLRESNRQQTEHMDVKLRAVNCRRIKLAGPHETDFEFTPDEIELLAEMEHARWNAERWLAGWRYSAGRDPVRRLSPYLVEWEKLPENIKDYDRDAVRNILGTLAQMGEIIERMA